MSHRIGAPELASLLGILLLVLSSCASPPYSTEYPPTSPTLISKDGRLRYAVPTGWFDATPSSKVPQSVVWIVKGDYAATITVNKITIEPETRREMGRARLLRLGQLTMQLMTGTRSAVILRPPQLLSMDGREYCMYEIEESATHDTVRVVVLDTGDAVYEVTALVAGGGQRIGARDIFSAQQAFLKRLQW